MNSKLDEGGVGGCKNRIAVVRMVDGFSGVGRFGNGAESASARPTTISRGQSGRQLRR
jgi:hypothetical protein